MTTLEAYQKQAQKVFTRNRKAIHVTVNDHVFKRGPNNTAVFVKKEVRIPKEEREDFHADG